MNEAVDIIYFWASILMVTLPIAAFSWLTYLVIKIYRREHKARSTEDGARSTEQKAQS